MPARKSGVAKRKREQCCKVEAAAREFLDQLQISKVYFDPEFDRCYCERCYKGSWPDTIEEEGPTPYVVPRGWFRFGLALQPRARDESFGWPPFDSAELCRYVGRRATDGCRAAVQLREY